LRFGSAGMESGMELNKNNIKNIFGIIVFAVLFYLGVQRFDVVLDIVAYIYKLVKPFVLGACIAYILSVPMRGIEKLLFGGKKARENNFVKKIKRPVSLLLTFVFVIGIIVFVLFLLIPELYNTGVAIADQIPPATDRLVAWAEKMFVQYPVILDQINALNINWDTVSKTIVSFIQTDFLDTLNSTLQVAIGIIASLVNFGIALFFSIYLLFAKETLARQLKKVLFAFLKEKKANLVLRISKLTDQTFSHFLSGQCVEAVILGLMFVIVLSILNFPYAVLIGVLIAFTALIPVFGAFIGAMLGVLLILLVNPMQAVWFLLIFVILQGIEGNLIYPHVVGNAVGLPALWVLVAVTIGGSMMGITGMLFFIPLVSVLYALFRELVYSRLQKRGIQQKLPESNEEGPGDGIVPAIQEDLSKGEQPADASVRTPDKGETSQSKMGSGVGSRRSGMQRKSKKK